MRYGKNFKLNGYTGTYHPLGGTILNATLDPRLTAAIEAGSGEGRQVTSHKIVAARPTIDWTMNIRRISDYIEPYAMISDEGEVLLHILHYSDGTKHRQLAGKVNTCRITIRQLESIKASIQVALEAWADLESVGTFQRRTDKAMFKDAVTTLSIGGIDVTAWSEVEFGVDNKVMQEILGTTIMPTEIEEQEAVYSGHIQRASMNPLDLDALAGTPKTVVIALQDKQGTPVTKTFTFTDALLKTARIRDNALGLIIERIEWQGDSLTIS